MAQRKNIRRLAFQPSNKYHSQKIALDGKTFDSKHEARRYSELALLQKAGQISDLQTQVKFVLIPTQREPDTIGKRGGVKKGACIEKECAYYADFVYKDADGNTIVEDKKSPATRTKDYKIKKKLMLFIHGIRIVER